MKGLHYISGTHNGTKKPSSPRWGPIKRNAARCRKCKEIVSSVNLHDFETCSCGAISVDGGSWYCRRVGNPGDYEDLTRLWANAPEGYDKLDAPTE